MQRKLIFITSGILFIIVSIVVFSIGITHVYKFKILMFALSIPFLFVGFWNLYSIVYEKRVGASNDYFTFKRDGQFSWGVGANYNKDIMVPVFLILFGCAAMAIVSGLLIATHDEIAVVLTILSFVYGLTVTAYFIVRFNRKTNRNLLNANADVVEVNGESLSDEIAMKIAFFFATLATFGLFALGYYIYKKYRK